MFGRKSQCKGKRKSLILPGSAFPTKLREDHSQLEQELVASGSVKASLAAMTDEQVTAVPKRLTKLLGNALERLGDSGPD